MSNAKEVRTQIKSIKNTQKITRAMEMVAASKMRKAQDKMLATRPYAEKISQVVGHLALSHPEYHHPFLSKQKQSSNKKGYIVISTDRGLCGGLNINLFKEAIDHIGDKQHPQFSLIGKKALLFFKKLSGNLISSVDNLGDSPIIEDIIGVIKSQTDSYLEGKINKLYLVKNTFVNSMSQKPKVLQLLPIVQGDDKKLKHHWDYIYEPRAKVILDMVMQRYIESIVYQALVENIACEMSARMVAMKSATDNAGDLIGELELVYNKARQSAITQELSEIVAGAAAV
jgi:F-type H+-transporting ATPase subunit gamma